MTTKRIPHRFEGQRPGRRGLYDPEFEHAACGVGFVCNLNREKSRRVVQNGLEMLENLAHRGACGCDETTGDGAGILIQMPDAFLHKVCLAEGIRLPQAGDYASGLVFLPRDADQRSVCMTLCEDVISQARQRFLGWRRVPTQPDALGALSREVAPAIFQVFIGRSGQIRDTQGFERRLYLIRKVIENKLRALKLSERTFFHVASLSARTVVYKGMFLAHQLRPFFPDLSDPDMASALALVHQRYSTNTFPAWDLAQPFRFLAHNGEINTLRGNLNWLRAREHCFGSAIFGADLQRLLPIATPGASDSAILDNVLELLHHSGRSLPHVMMMLIPEAWEHHADMGDDRKAFYDYHRSLTEPWDGPAAIAFSDGRWVGAVLDRNGLRPSRYTVTKDGWVIMASEAGVLEVDPANVRLHGRLQPGKMFLVDVEQGRIVADEAIKSEVCRRRNYRKWLHENRLSFDALPLPQTGPAEPANGGDEGRLQQRQRIFGYSREDLSVILEPMAFEGKEPTGSMGDDIPPAILSRRPRLLFDYFKQLFAQVTNPPLDAIREAMVTSLQTMLGEEHNLLDETPRHCRQLLLERPILTGDQMARLAAADRPGLRSAVLSAVYRVADGGAGLKTALADLFEEAEQALAAGATVLILSDQRLNGDQAPIPSLLAASGLHHHLIRRGLRTRCGIVVESGEAREVHHFCCLLGYGAAAIHPYLAFETIAQMNRDLKTVAAETAVTNYIRVSCQGILKVMSKMGISTLQSYRGAQIFESVGLHPALVAAYFTGTPSRVGGADLEQIAAETALRHRQAFAPATDSGSPELDAGGKYRWRRDGEAHQYTPVMLARFRQAVFDEDAAAWQEYTQLVDGQNRREGLLRGLIRIKPGRRPLPLDQVEPWTAIVKRFKTGAMSYGSLSKEAHETLAVAMNRIGARSNSGEGGEDPDRYHPDPDGNWRNSAIKQVASGRFGVTSNYLVNAAELQIKMAQGAKPGEGGQLPAFKVYPWIAATRHSTPYVGLISPPPHHDIYSIEDLAQLIYDLRCANPSARISVKLVSEVGVGTVAAGVAKAGADVVLISGDVGGTGASPQSSIRYGGLPWELGLPEAQQTLVVNGLRSRIVLECDGQIKTARDVAVACLLGAEEFGFGTIALVALGCVMMRVCHLNTCPVGIATQDPVLRKKFAGRPEHVVNLMRFLAEDLRKIMAEQGFRTLVEMVGRVDRLELEPAVDHWKARGLDFSALLHAAEPAPAVAAHCMETVRVPRELDLDTVLIDKARAALETGQPVKIDLAIRNVHRTVGTRLSSEISKRYGENGLPAETITIHARGSAGQSFCAFGARGLTVIVVGDANDYFGKGLSGARLVLRPPPAATFAAEENIIVGNVAFYGATAGEAYIRGIAGERFCVRNSGARAVVEGTGDHACEYMTGGCVAILGPTGRNSAAGMSGGVAYVLDETGDFARLRCNLEMVELEPLADTDDIAELKQMIANHQHYTESPVATRILGDWNRMLEKFVKIMPRDYKRALKRLETEAMDAAG